MGLLNHMESLTLGSKKDRRASGGPAGDVADGRDADTSTLDKEEGNILMSLISQRESARLHTAHEDGGRARRPGQRGGSGGQNPHGRAPHLLPLPPARCPIVPHQRTATYLSAS